MVKDNNEWAYYNSGMIILHENNKSGTVNNLKYFSYKNPGTKVVTWPNNLRSLKFSLNLQDI